MNDNESFAEKLRIDANGDSPTCQESWSRLQASDRRSAVNRLLSGSEWGSLLQVVDAAADGQILLRLSAPLPVERRSEVLLGFESILKANLDSGLVVWLEPLGDKNSLRRLRGVEVRKEA